MVVERISVMVIRKFNLLSVQIVIVLIAGLLLGIISVLLSPLWVLAGLVILSLAFIVIMRPEIGLLGYLIITSTIIDQNSLPRIPIGVGRLLITDIILLGLLGLILIRSLAEHDFKIFHSPLDIPLLAFIGIAILSTILAILRSTITLNDSLGELRNIMSYLTFFIVTNLVRRDQQLRTLIGGLFLLAAIVALAMIAQFILGNSVHILPGRVETLGTEGVQFLGVTRIIPPGESLVFVTFITITVILALKRYKLSQSLYMLLWCLTGVGVILTFKRHLWLSALLILLFFACIGWRKIWPRIVGGVLAFGIVLFIIFAIILSSPESGMSKLVLGAFERLSSLTNPQTFNDPNSSLRWRDFEYQYALPQIASHPWFGLGLGAIYRPFVIGKDTIYNNLRHFIHNGHLYIMVKSGLLSYLCFFTASVIFLLRGIKNWQQIPNSQSQAILIGFTLSYIGVLIGSIVSPMIIRSWWTPVIGIMMGVNEVILREKNTKGIEINEQQYEP
jgi:O-antigen ligase